ncbi:hypothetical protein O181_091671 [Austropuccinia psidii MF-1]|uniref:Uncharacterized protein n=1 Tax=Austropuccinia psidii MF-1 TaxID=1389203 RepID=A0A9Q3IXZ7_9BASI|nr:hypothetical protein [Austropuccinia psidii MF-1]
MANLTPDSQLSSYKRINRQLSGNQDQLDDVHLGQMSPNFTNENMEQTNSGQITAPREGVEDWADDSTNIQSQTKGSQTVGNIPGTSRSSHRNSVSHLSSVSRGTTRRDRNFMNNMNTNMQNVLSPLMLMLQQSQDCAEERDWMQRSRDDERQMLMREHEEEQ